MTSTDVSSDTSAQTSEAGAVDMNLEVVRVPVSDVDGAKRFYQGLGWRLDADLTASDAFRVVQCTPRHSACSDINAARADLVDRGVEVSEVCPLARRLGGRGPLLGRSKARRGPVSSSCSPRDHLGGTIPERGSLPSPYERTG
jgi:hypothetical protein